MNVRDIQFAQEKKAIMLYYMKRTYGKKIPDVMNYTKMLSMYQHWWKEDMRMDGEYEKYRRIIPGKKQIRLPVSGIVIDEEYQKYFDDMYDELALKYKTLSVEDTRKERMGTHLKFGIPLRLQREAQKIGYKIQQNNIREHPYKLSGYRILSLKGKNVVFGTDWDMTINDIENWINSKKKNNHHSDKHFK